MSWICLALVAAAFVIAMPLSIAMLRLGRRLAAFDSPGRPGQMKAAPRRIPNTGGPAIFWAIAVPLGGAVAAAFAVPESTIAELLPPLGPHVAGLREQSTLALVYLGSLALLHITGLIDDRRPLPAAPKLAVILAACTAVVVTSDTRLLTALDPYAGGPWLSIAISILWIGVVTNAMNFMDNMDGLAAGVAAIAGACFLAATLVGGQWFVAALLALLVGASLGFLVLNFPPARIFMGDSGSLVLGFTLGFLTVRTTYYGTEAGNWYAVFMPLIVLAIPLYDFASVMTIRVRQGRSPFVGDMQHFSHRLVDRGLSRRDAVLLIYALTAVTGIAGISLGSLRPWQAALVGVQTLLILGVLALFEWSAPRRVD